MNYLSMKNLNPLFAMAKNEKKIIGEEIVWSDDNQLFPAWDRLIRGTLVKRYKRFLADITLEDGQTVTAHCPNSGSMKACSDPGRPVYVTYHDSPKRKLKYTWELIEMPTSLVGVNTLVPNRLIFDAVKTGQISPFREFQYIKAEKKLESGSRLDLFLWNEDADRCFIEIKNCTMVSNGVASFPDAVTTRGQKHLRELQLLQDNNTRCAMLFLIQRSDASRFTPADGIDPEYGRELRKAVKNGVEIYVYDTEISLAGIRVNRPIPFDL